MPRIPIIRLRPTAEQLEPPRLTRYTPTISLEGLQVGVDNLRHDVHLSFKFVDQARLQIARLIVRHGGMEGLLAAEALEKARGSSADSMSKPTGKVQASELKPLLSDFHIAALNHAKAAGNLSVDMLARLAIIKFFRIELSAQFAQLLERSRMMLKGYEGVRQQKALEYREMVGAGGEDCTRSQKARLQIWTDLLDRDELMEYAIASYEVAPLLSEYSPRINPQQLKHALISRHERERVEKLIEEHGKLSCESLYSAMARVAGCRGAERDKIAGRFLRDFMRYHRDLRRLEALNGALDSVNLVGNQKIRDLSAMNGTLYEFMLPQERKLDEDKILRHVIVKADVRDSSRLTRSLLERRMNPASYFSLNFYDPVNKLLAKYGAEKVFLEGDAIILGLLERQGDKGLAVSRACVLSFPQLWRSEEFRLLLGTVPIGNDIFRKIVVRVSRIPQIDPSTFSLHKWTERTYYEVCTNPAVYAALEGKAAAGK